MITEIFVKYWLQWIFGIIAAGVAIWARHYVKLERERIQEKQKERMQELRVQIKDEIIKELNDRVAKLNAEDEKICQELDKVLAKVEIVSSGVLAIQRQSFKIECRRLLKEDHHITLQEFEQLQKDHKVYNDLGGNDSGDALFKAAESKYIKSQ